MTEDCQSSDGDSIGETVLEGIALRRAGRITAAEVLFQSVLSEQPRHADALHQLGLRPALGWPPTNGADAECAPSVQSAS